MLPKEKKEEFAALFEEFVQNYLARPEGQKHLAEYQKCRNLGEANFNKVVSAQARGEDITDAVLKLFLPYTDSANHRKTGVWITIAPAITGDVKDFFQKAGWTKPEDWPDVSNAILHFTQQCNEDPNNLDEACRKFAELPYTTGLQTGMLTPILNALRPDDFLIVNKKSRSIINYLTNKNYKLSITDYPSINAAGFEILGELGDTIRNLSHSDAPVSDLFDEFSHWLVAIKKHPFGKTGSSTRYWKIAPGGNARFWDEWRSQNYISIGWDELGNLTGMTRENFAGRVNEVRKAHPDWTKTALNQVWEFAHIKEGDRVLANRGTSEILGIGTVTGPYEFTPGIEHGHRLPVEWNDLTTRKINEGGWRRTLISLTPEKFDQLCNAPPAKGVAREPYSLERCAEETGFDEETLSQWLMAIERKGQAILYGPPGTGKTYVAERLARHLSTVGDGFMDLVQFHPTYAYEDFIQGIRPVGRDDGGLDYPLVPGRFLEFCEEARERDNTCVLIIDEINRAELSRVFGELMYLLEYRDQAIPLAGGHQFSIPKNVCIIGTMNTADRSIALVDHALRRRFAFIALYPNYDILSRYHEHTGYDVTGLIEMLRQLNREIGDKHYAVGVSFFLRDDLGTQIEDIWRMEIEPYLEEYFFDQPEKVVDFRWEKIEEKVTP